MTAIHSEDHIDKCFLSVYSMPTTRVGTKGDAKAAENTAPTLKQTLVFPVRSAKYLLYQLKSL